MRRFVIAFFITAMLLTLAACGGRQADADETAAETQREPMIEYDENKYLPETTETRDEDAESAQEEDETVPEEARVRALLDGMTLEEKVGQLFFVDCPAAGVEEAIGRYHLGGILLFTRDYKDAQENWLTADAFTAKLQSWQIAAAYDTGIPLFIGSDEEGGTVTRASRDPYLFPEKSRSPQELYAAGGLGTILNDAAQKSELLLSYGVNVNFAPVCDVSTDPEDFIYERSFGAGAAETMAYVVGVVSVMRDQGIGSVLKHFPGYGNNADTHTGISIDERPLAAFRNADLLPFTGGIRAGAPFVLVSHNVVKCMDDTLPASLSPDVHELLREDLGFDGVILTDDLAMDAVKAYAVDGRVAVLALLAGNDMLVTAEYETQIPQVLDAVRDGTLSESVIDAACTRVLTAKLRLGLLGE